jgi:hypothetical protein
MPHDFRRRIPKNERIPPISGKSPTLCRDGLAQGRASTTLEAPAIVASSRVASTRAGWICVNSVSNA